MLLQQQQLLGNPQAFIAAPNPGLGLAFVAQPNPALNPNTPLLTTQQQLALSAQLQVAQQQILLQNKGLPSGSINPSQVRKLNLKFRTKIDCKIKEFLDQNQPEDQEEAENLMGIWQLRIQIVK